MCNGCNNCGGKCQPNWAIKTRNDFTDADRVKLADAFERTLNAYVDLINDPKNNIEKWKTYGGTDSCRICVKMEEILHRHMPCEKCALNFCAGINFRDATTAIDADARTTFDGMQDVIANYAFGYGQGHRLSSVDWERISDIATARYEWLLRRITEAGFAVTDDIDDLIPW